MKCEPFWPTPRLPSLLHPSRGGLGPTLFPRLRRRQRIRRVLRAPGRGARGARPSRVSGPAPPARSAPPRPAPPRTRVGAGCWRLPDAGTPQPSPRATAAASARPGGPSSAAGSPRCPRLQSGGAQSERLVPEPGGGRDAELCALSQPHDPEHVGPGEEGAPRLHLEPQWPRHDPLLLCQRGHLAERHQPAVSAPSALPPSVNARKVCFSAAAFPRQLGASKGEIASCLLAGLGASGGIVRWRGRVILGGRKCPGGGEADRKSFGRISGKL